MIANFYRCSDDPRTVNKNIGEIIVSRNCAVTGQCDIVTPLLILDYNKEILTCNYFNIPDWERFYFMSPPNVDKAGRMYITGNVDVVYTYRDALKSCSGTAIRNEGIGMPTDVIDPSLPIVQGSEYVTNNRFETSGIDSDYDPDGNYYLLTTV